MTCNVLMDALGVQIYQKLWITEGEFGPKKRKIFSNKRNFKHRKFELVQESSRTFMY